jgi:hypothetical protein
LQEANEIRDKSKREMTENEQLNNTELDELKKELAEVEQLIK